MLMRPIAEGSFTIEHALPLIRGIIDSVSGLTLRIIKGAEVLQNRPSLLVSLKCKSVEVMAILARDDGLPAFVDADMILL